MNHLENMCDDILEYDQLFEEIAREAVSSQQISMSMIYRNYEVGFNRAGRIMLQLEQAGIAGPQIGTNPRKIFITDIQSLEERLTDIRNGDFRITDIINSDSYKEEQVRLQSYLEEREKAEIAAQIMARHRRSQLEKIVRQELIDSGELFGEQPKRPPIPREVVDAVYKRDGGRCVYCGATDNLQLDHIIPFSKGGATTIENLQLLCQKCNIEKSNKIG